MTAAAQSSRNGYSLPPEGRLHALVIYAAFSDRPAHTSEVWPSGRLPRYASGLFDARPEIPADAPFVNLTQYFWEMSGGGFVFTADYLPRLFQIPAAGLSSFQQANTRLIDSVNRWLEKHPERALTPLFDRWTIGKPYHPKTPVPNGKWDFIIVVYQNGNTLPWIGAAGGVWMDFSHPLQGRTADNCFVLTQSHVSPYPINILVHEIAHGLLGGNAYHAMGAAAGGELRYGNTVQFGMHRGWGMLGGNDFFQTINAWERDRLGWHPEGARIVRIHPDSLPNGDTLLRLRDFITIGDAVRIYLPHTQNPRQYIWLEAHLKWSPFDRRWQEPEMKGCIEDRLPPAVYAYYQIGIDNPTILRPAWTDFLFPISAEGNWDYEVESQTRMICYAGHPENVLRKVRPNPLSGYNDFRYLFFDVGTPDHPEGDGQILANRHPSGKATHGNNLCYTTSRSTALQACDARPVPGNGGNIDVVQPYAERIGNSVYIWHSWGPEDAFTVGRAMGIDGNPTAAGVFFRGGHRREGNGYVAAPALRPIILNGLYVAVVDRSDTDFSVYVSYRRKTLQRPQRWAGGAIHVVDTFTVRSRLVIDRSGTPNACFPYTSTGDFMPVTHVKVRPGGGLIVGKKGRIIIRKDAVLDIDSAALLDVKSGGKIVVNGGELRLPERYQKWVGRTWWQRLFSPIRTRSGGKVVVYSEASGESPRRGRESNVR